MTDICRLPCSEGISVRKALVGAANAVRQCHLNRRGAPRREVSYNPRISHMDEYGPL